MGLFAEKPVTQAAALPYVWIRGQVSVLLITSRRRKRWQIPKGWPVKGVSLAETAAREAQQEAGVVGRVHQKPVGSYAQKKRMAEGYEIRCSVLVFPLFVTAHCLNWRERTQRELQWCELGRAADIVAGNGLTKLISEVAKNGAIPDPIFIEEQVNGYT